MNMKSGAVLVLGGSPRTLSKVQELGLAIVHIEDPTMVMPMSAKFCERSLVHDIADIEGIVAFARELHVEWGFVAVISNHEPAIAPTQAIAKALELPNSEVGSLLRNKSAVRRALEGTELELPWAPLTSRADLEAFVRNYGLPAIAKPTTGSASLGVFTVDRKEEVGHVWQKIESLLKNGHRYDAVLPLSDYMVEKYVEGPEFSVESFSVKGKHEVLAIVDKTTNEYSVEIGHTVPALISECDKQQIESTVAQFLDLVGLTNGPAHTEVIRGLDRVTVIESHARTGGDGISELVEQVTGRDAERDLVSIAAGLPLKKSQKPTAMAASKRFLTAKSGRVVSISGLEAAKACPGVIDVEIDVNQGDQVHEANASWWRVGEVVAVGSTPEAAASRAQAAAARVQIEVV